MQHFPAAGEVVIFDRSWYNRAGVEYVMGFCTKEQHRRFLELCPEIEKYIVDGGIQLIKIWLEVSDEEQKRRFEARIDDPLRQWKLSPMDLPSRSKWFEYSRARDLMLKATDTKCAPWYILRSDDKKRARLNCIRAHPEPDSLQESAAREGQAAQALDEGRLRRPGVAQGPEVRAGEVLTDTVTTSLEPGWIRPTRSGQSENKKFAAAPTPEDRSRERQPKTNNNKRNINIKSYEKTNLVLIGLATLLASATQASQEQLATSIKDAQPRNDPDVRAAQGHAERLNALTKQTKGDLRPAYNTYCAEVTKTEAAAAWTRTRVQWMAGDGRKYFQDWQTTVNGIANESLRKKSQKRLDAVKKSYNKVEASLQQAGEKFKPFLSDLADIQKALATDVTAGGVKAIQEHGQERQLESSVR